MFPLAKSFTSCLPNAEERNFTAYLTQEEDFYVAECPEVGTVSQGYTIEEAIANLKEATQLYLEEFMQNVSSPISD
jgi:predicted RNase H-like HicB family nuclease